MKSKKLIASTLVLSICSALLLTSCNNGNQGDKIRVECDVISVDDVDRVLSQADTTEENKVRLYYNYKDVLPTHEYYIYISDTDVIRGATGWYEHKAR